MAQSPTEPKSFEVVDQDLSSDLYFLFEKSPAIAIDTEAMGLIHGRDRLCLVQICDQDDNVACIRIKQGQQFAPKLKALMENTNIEKVFHFARFDVAALRNGLNIQVNPIFCTKIASKLARTYTPRHGLKDLVLELTGVELDKQSQSSDWGKTDSLSEAQLIYAANDTRYLLTAQKVLKSMLSRENRWHLAKNCFKCIPTICELDILKFNQIFEH